MVQWSSFEGFMSEVNRDEDIMGFQREIRAVIQRAKGERDLRVAEVIGVLQMEIMEFFECIPPHRKTENDL